MSGIIGGIGSKSGVIGTTELDYEEGTWTPAFTSTSATFSYTTQNGSYTKIGNTVHWTMKIQTNLAASGTLSNALSVTGLPFTSMSGNIGYATSIGQVYNVNWRTSMYALVGLQGVDSTSIALGWVTDDAGTTTVTAEDFDKAVLLFVMSGTYFV